MCERKMEICVTGCKRGPLQHYDEWQRCAGETLLGWWNAAWHSVCVCVVYAKVAKAQLLAVLVLRARRMLLVLAVVCLDLSPRAGVGLVARFEGSLVVGCYKSCSPMPDRMVYGTVGTHDVRKQCDIATAFNNHKHLHLSNATVCLSPQPSLPVPTGCKIGMRIWLIDCHTWNIRWNA